MKVTNEMVDYVSELSRLRLDEQSKEKMRGELQQIIAYMDVLNALDTTGGGAYEPRVPGEERAAGGRGEALQPSPGLAGQRAGPDEAAFLVPKAVE